MSDTPARFREKAQVLDEAALDRALTRIAHEILERNKGAEDLAFVGLRLAGSPSHSASPRRSPASTAPRCPCGALDITLYRDDLDDAREPRRPGHRHPLLHQGQDASSWWTTCSSPAGRSAPRWTRSSTSAGRSPIQLAILVDRGHRELPIRADYIGKNLPTSRREQRAGTARARHDGEDECRDRGLRRTRWRSTQRHLLGLEGVAADEIRRMLDTAGVASRRSPSARSRRCPRCAARR